MENRPTDSFDFRFHLSEARFTAAHRAHLRRSVFTVKNLFLVTIALMIGAVQAQLFGGAGWALRVFVGLWLAVLGLVLYVFVRMPSRIYRSMPGLAGEHRIHVNSGGLDWEVEGLRKTLTWPDVAKASDDPDSVYIFPKQGLPWVLPKDVFESEAEMKAFDAFVGRMLMSSR